MIFIYQLVILKQTLQRTKVYLFISLNHHLFNSTKTTIASSHCWELGRDGVEVGLERKPRELLPVTFRAGLTITVLS